MITIAVKGPTCPNAKNSLSPCKIGFDGDFADNAIINWPFAPRFDRFRQVWLLMLIIIEFVLLMKLDIFIVSGKYFITTKR